MTIYDINFVVTSLPSTHTHTRTRCLDSFIRHFLCLFEPTPPPASFLLSLTHTLLTASIARTISTRNRKWDLNSVCHLP